MIVFVQDTIDTFETLNITTHRFMLLLNNNFKRAERIVNNSELYWQWPIVFCCVINHGLFYCACYEQKHLIAVSSWRTV